MTTMPLAVLAVTTLTGKLVFAAVFGLLILWLLFIPRTRLVDAEMRNAAPWRNVRYWAIAIATFQMLVYLLWR